MRTVTKKKLHLELDAEDSKGATRLVKEWVEYVRFPRLFTYRCSMSVQGSRSWMKMDLRFCDISNTAADT